MHIFCGTDIIEIDRIRDSIENLGDSFKNRIYTKKEIEYCESKNKMKYQHYAARFAGKEAIFKAISNLLVDKFELSWQNAEILNDESGKPYIHFINTKIIEKIQDIDISISHCKEYAIANVVILLKENENEFI